MSCSYGDIDSEAQFLREYARKREEKIWRERDISVRKARIRDAEQNKKSIELTIANLWRELEKLCGHPEVRITPWSTAECLTCGFYNATSYFVENFDSTVIDVDGTRLSKSKAKKEKKDE